MSPVRHAPGRRRVRREARPRPVPPAASLASVAGRRTTLLGGVGIPLYLVGAVVTEGAGRWLMLAMTAFLALAACLPPRQLQVREAPVTVAMCVGAVLLWGWVAPAEPLLAATGLAAGAVFLGLMVPRPYAEIGLGAVTVAYLGSQWAIGVRGDHAWQVAGVAATDLALGALMLGIRVTTERQVGERTRALAEANDRLERLARTDPLTGLANRRRLEEVLAACARPVCAIMIDIDHFKQYNDRYGHPAGDACLRTVAAVLTHGARGTDVVARYGGEEFCVILPDTGLDDACRVAERIRAEIAGLREEHGPAPLGFLTVSAGVAATAAGPGEDLIARADAALYRAKRDGRDRVAAGVADPVPS
jgi:diguanylate cyclase (GGDEF)-like protein